MIMPIPILLNKFSPMKRSQLIDFLGLYQSSTGFSKLGFLLW